MTAPIKLRENSRDCITLARRIAPAITHLAAAAAVLVAAEVIRASPVPQFTSGVNVVEVYASVTDDRGEPVRGLTKEDFELREDGELQDISTFTAGDFPLSVAIAIDRSFSMAGDRLTLAKSAARVFLGELRPGDESMILAIGSEVEAVTPLSPNRPAQFEALSRLDSFGTTGLHDAIVAAIGEVQGARGRRALVLLSDGDDRYSRATAEQALARARGSDVMIFPVALGRERPRLFAELATLTGGRSHHVRDPKLLTGTLRAIARELKQQYLLGYTPTRALVAGENQWRSIDVRVKEPGRQVRARDGYLVK